MKPAPFDYHDPRSIADAIGLIGKLENAKLLAGGQSLVPMLNMRYVVVDHVVDLNRIPELAFIRDTGAALELGAMKRQRDVERSAEARRRLPILAEALGHVGHFQTRNRGTIGGSLCHLDPAAELPGIALALDAELTVEGPRGRRTVKAADWAQFAMTPALEPDELLTRIAFPVWPEKHGEAFLELARRHGDFAIIGVACFLALDAGRIARAAIALVGAGEVPLRLAAAERALVGEAPSDEVFRAAGAEATKIEATSDAQTSAAYRRRVAGVMVERALRIAAERAAA